MSLDLNHVTLWLSAAVIPQIFTGIGVLVATPDEQNGNTRFINEFSVKTQLVYPTFYIVFLRVTTVANGGKNLPGANPESVFAAVVIPLTLSLFFYLFGMKALARTAKNNGDERIHAGLAVQWLVSFALMLAAVISTGWR